GRGADQQGAAAAGAGDPAERFGGRGDGFDDRRADGAVRTAGERAVVLPDRRRRRGASRACGATAASAWSSGARGPSGGGYGKSDGQGRREAAPQRETRRDVWGVGALLTWVARKGCPVRKVRRQVPLSRPCLHRTRGVG